MSVKLLVEYTEKGLLIIRSDDPTWGIHLEAGITGINVKADASNIVPISGGMMFENFEHLRKRIISSAKQEEFLQFKSVDVFHGPGSLEHQSQRTTR
jgi:hypothetical protein